MRFCRTTLLLLTVTSLLPEIAVAERSVVLVTGESCPMSEISMLDVRKAYLGVAVSVDGGIIRPFRLGGDEMLNQVFYQSIVAMSEKSYDRRVLSLALKYGTPRPPVFDDIESAVAALRRAKCSIIYLWKKDADDLAGVKTIKLLWQGE